jgi:uncharacterized protein
MMTRRELLKSAIAPAIIRIAKGEGEAMEQRISIVTLGVSDLAASRRFYLDGLGWKPVFENKEIVFFQADPASFGRAAVALAHNVRTKAEVDPLIRRAAEAGATILKPAREASWGGYSGYFADPDGFAWEVAWNPAWKITADGSIEFH